MLDGDPQIAGSGPLGEGIAGPFGEVAGGPASAHSESAGVAQETAREILDAEASLRLAREHFQDTEDPEVQGQLAAEALDQVERH